MARYRSEEFVCPKDHPHLANEAWWYVFDTQDQSRSVGCYATQEICDNIVDKKNLYETKMESAGLRKKPEPQLEEVAV